MGSAMALAVANASDAEGRPLYNVIGVDLANDNGQARIDSINNGRTPFDSTDVDMARAMASATKSGNLSATYDPSVYEQAEIILVSIHLDVGEDHERDVAYDDTGLRKAIRTIGANARPGALVIVETTVPPGTCATVVWPELKAAAEGRGLSEDAFMLAHSYERVMPGPGYMDSIVNYWRVYAGGTESAADACEAFLSSFVNVDDYPLTRVSNMTASETAKVLENSYRAVNIAFIEEWTRFAEAAGIDLFEVVNAVRVRPTHANIRQPGLGVGGYCLTKDPLFGEVSARKILDRPDLEFPFCRQAISINRKMPLATLRRLEEGLGGNIKGKEILLLGVSYRSGVADTRFSPSEVFVREARARGARLSVQDPMVKYWDEMEEEVPTQISDPGRFDAIVFAVDHEEYGNLEPETWLGRSRPVIVDANNALTSRQVAAFSELGCSVICTGVGVSVQ